MAIISPEVTLALCGIFIVRRLSRFSPPAHRWLEGLTFWMPPTLEELQSIVPRIDKKGSAGSRESQVLQMLETLPERARALLRRKRRPIGPSSLRNMAFYSHFDVMVTLAIVSTFVALGSYVAVSVRGVPVNGIPSAGLLLAAAAAMITMLGYLAEQGWTAIESRAAGALGLFTGFILYLLLRIPHPLFDFSLREGFNDLWRRSGVLADHFGIERGASGNYRAFEISTVLSCAVAAAALFLPAMRFARSLLAALSEPGRGRAVDDREKQPGFLKRALLYVDFFLPLFLALLWVRPMTGSLVLTRGLVRCSESDPLRDCVPDGAGAGAVAASPLGFVVTESMWDAARLTAVLLAAAVRLWTLRTHLQAFLRGAAAPDVVADVVSDMMQRPAAQGPKRGRAGAALRAKQLADEKKGENEGDRQQQVARALRSRYVAHYAFVCAAAALHVAPAVLTSSLALLLLQHVNVDLGVGTALRGALPAALTRRAASSTDDVGAHMMAAALKSLFPGLQVEALHIFSPLLLHSVLSLLLWWTLLVWFAFSAMGFAYFNFHRQGGLRANEAQGDGGKPAGQAATAPSPSSS